MNTDLHDERQFAYKIGLALDQGAERLPGDLETKLHAARTRALAHQKVALAGFSLAGVGQTVSDALLPHMRTLAAFFTLCIAVLCSYYWNNYQQAVQNAEIDSALLADDLPINAYLDRGFRAWLEYPSESSQQ